MRSEHIFLAPLQSDEPYKASKHKFLALEWLADASAYRVDRLTAERHASVGTGAAPKQEAALSLAQCLRAFTKEEILGENDPWYCSDCKKHQRASKMMNVWKLPHVLIIHLKRFSYTRVYRDKIATFVDFPLSGLDLSEFTGNQDDQHPIYDLYAVSNHMGGMGGGHYTGMC